LTIRRPKSPNEPPPGPGDIELVEHLVKKSLDINPALRNSKKTAEVMTALREEARARAQGGSPGSTTANLSKTDRRKQTITFFFTQKQEDFDEAVSGILERERALAAEKAALQGQFIQELADFLQMATGGVDSPEAREVVHSFRKFVTDLGINEAELFVRARRAR
jgi:hypothetical protein